MLGNILNTEYEELSGWKGATVFSMGKKRSANIDGLRR